MFDTDFGHRLTHVLCGAHGRRVGLIIHMTPRQSQVRFEASRNHQDTHLNSVLLILGVPDHSALREHSNRRLRGSENLPLSSKLVQAGPGDSSGDEGHVAYSGR